MDDAEFQRWAELLRKRTGMNLSPVRRAFLASVIDQRMRQLGLTGYDGYYAYVLADGAGMFEWRALVGRLTVQETRFFRDPSALQLLTHECLPAMAQRIGTGEAVHVWSVGCATGEEPFTLAMLIDRYLQSAGVRPYFGVVGSDISLQALAHARLGCYSEARLAGIPAAYRAYYCRTRPAGGFRVANHLRRRVCFIHANVLDAANVSLPAMDLIYCQNVLLYFDRAQREAIATALADRLRPGATLVLGAGELVGWQRSDLQRVGGTDLLAYRRRKT
ncbi:MAG TPA: CheR family methyltransferase [Nitrococcus sp.]|nr:CheR family methyltransferase [Nitrococcus sp.]